MRKITRSIFVAEDGTEFIYETECLRHERLNQVRGIIEEHMVNNVVLDVSELTDAIMKWHYDEKE